MCQSTGEVSASLLPVSVNQAVASPIHGVSGVGGRFSVIPGLGFFAANETRLDTISAIFGFRQSHTG